MSTDTLDNRKDQFNNFGQLPLIPYNIISYLINDESAEAELIWKLLKYTTADGWNEANLTREQKAALIWNGNGNQSDYNVFFTTGQEDANTTMNSILKVSVVRALPLNRVYGEILIGVEAYCHDKISVLSNYQPRVDTLIQSVVKVINGADISGVGRVYFDQKRNNQCDLRVIGSAPFRGKVALLTIDAL